MSALAGGWQTGAMRPNRWGRAVLSAALLTIVACGTDGHSASSDLASSTAVTTTTSGTAARAARSTTTHSTTSPASTTTATVAPVGSLPVSTTVPEPTTASTSPPTPPTPLPTVPPTPPTVPAPQPPPATVAVEAVELPAPVAAPADDGSREPRVDLGTIEIPRIGLARPMLEGIRLTTLDNGPGHWPGTAMPGELGNVVVAGHRVSHNADFRDIDELQPGDEVIFSTSAGRHVYRVSSTEIVLPDAIWIVDQTPAPTATLFACHPPGSTRERIVVHLELAAA